MSTNQPPPQEPGQGGQPGGPPPVPPQGQWSAPVPQPSAPRSRRKGVTIGVAGVVVVGLVVGAGVFAWAKLSGGGPQPAEAVPADAVAYVRLDLDPSAEQKLNAMSLLQKWPEFEEVTGISQDDIDLRELFMEEAMSIDECDVSYDDDIEPWIGDRLALAVVPDKDAPTPLLTVQVKDEDDAETAMGKLDDCLGGGLSTSPMSATATDAAYGTSAAADAVAAPEESKLGVAFSGEYMLLAPSQDLADQFASDATDDPLSSDDTFRDDMDALGDEGIASAWVDATSFVDIAEQLGAPPASIESLEKQDLGSGAVALRAGDDYLEIASSSTSSVGQSDVSSGVEELPESTMAAVSIADGKSMVDKFWSQFESGMTQTDPSAGRMLAQIEARSGLSLPDDVATLLGDQAMFAIDSEGLDPSAPPQQLSDINAGLRLTSDPEDLGAVIDKLTGLIEQQGGSTFTDGLVREDTEDGMVLASNDDYAAALTDGGGGLGDSETFQNAVPDAEDASNVVYVDFDRIASLGDEVSEDLENIEPIEAFGFSTSSQDGRADVTMRLTFD